MFSLAQELSSWRKVETPDMQIVWTDMMVPAPLYAELEAAWPTMPAPKIKSKQSYLVRRDVQAPDIAPVWTSFWDGLLSPESLSAMVDHWRLQKHPLPGFRALVDRPHVFAQRKAEGSVLYSASFRWRAPSANDPVISPHVDNPKSLCYLLWYFPVRGDTSFGGDLVFLRRKVKQPEHPKDFEIVLRVPYVPNCAVLALNGPDVIHAVVPRVKAAYPRRHVGLALDAPTELFELLDRHALPSREWTAANVAGLLAQT